MNHSDKPVAVVAGVGPGNGESIARRYAEGGYRVAMLSRKLEHIEPLADELDGALAVPCDVSDAAAVSSAFDRVERELGVVDVLIYNAGAGVFADVESITPEQFEQAWRVNAYGALLCSQRVIGPMKKRRRGSVVFIGATASLRGGKNTAAFAPAKAAQRSLAESIARQLWPAGIHVALVIIDGVVDLPRTRKAMPDKPDEFFVDPDGVAEITWQLTQQPRQAWSFEVQARPFGESW